jgi:AcrR family transcriptional regulator
MTDQRPYATLHAKGEDRRQRILGVAQRLLARNGWRGTTLGQIAREAGVTSAGVLHHFESKEQLLHAVLKARDEDDLVNVNLRGDASEQIAKAAERFERSPHLIGTYILLLVENLDPEAPMHARLHKHYQGALDVVAEVLRRGQREGRYRADLDAAVKAVEIVAFMNGMETLWLLDPSMPVAAVCRGYTAALAQDLAVRPSPS